jgi:hypothetical protein
MYCWPTQYKVYCSGLIINYFYKADAGPSGCAIWGSYGLGLLEYWDCGFESRLRHECIPPFFYVLLSCVRRGLKLESVTLYFRGTLVCLVFR